MGDRRSVPVVLLSLFVIVSLLFSSVPSVAAADPPIRLYVDGQELQADVPPQIIDGRTLVPVRVVADHLGFTVEWIAETQTVRLTGPRTVELRLGSSQARVDGRKVTLDVPARSVEGRTLVPLRFIAEALGYDVAWDGQARAVRLTAPRVQVGDMWVDPEIADRVKITVDRDEQDMTVVRGTVDPRLGWQTVALVVHTGDEYSRRRAPVVDGAFAVSAAVPGGESVPVFLSSHGGDGPFATFTVLHPGEVHPRVLSEHGVEVIDIWTEEPADRLSASVTPEGMLRLEGTLAGPVSWVRLRGLSGRNMGVNLEDGRFETVLPLKGPARYRLCVHADPNTLRGCVIAEQTQEVNLEPITLWSDQVQLEEPLASGLTVGDSMRVAGQAQDLPDPMVMFNVTKLGGSEKLVSRQTLPVRDGRFEGRVWFPFGAGEYEVSVWRPVGGSTWSMVGAWNVTSTVAEELRWLIPTRGVESDAPEILALAEEITRGLSTPMEKARAMHDWVAQNVAYDVEKYLNGTFEPDDGALKTLATRKGVCQDYAYLTAALLRAAGIKARIASGEANGYGGWGGHAWTEAWVDDRWLIMDTTWDAGYVEDDQFYWKFDTKYFDPDPEVFTQDHRLERHQD